MHVNIYTYAYMYIYKYISHLHTYILRVIYILGASSFLSGLSFGHTW